MGALQFILQQSLSVLHRLRRADELTASPGEKQSGSAAPEDSSTVKTTGIAGGFDSFLQIDGRIHAVDIALIEFPAQKFDGLTKPLEMDDLPLPEEFDDIVHIRVVGEPQDVVVGDPCLLLWERIA